MNLTKALKTVLVTWRITPYRLSKASGVSNAVLSRILNTDGESFTWTTIEKLSEGIGKINPAARASFKGLLFEPDDAVPDPPEPTMETHIHDIAQFAIEMAQLAGEQVDPVLVEAAMEGQLDYHYLSFMDWMFGVMAKHNPKPPDYIPPHRSQRPARGRPSKKREKKEK